MCKQNGSLISTVGGDNAPKEWIAIHQEEDINITGKQWRQLSDVSSGWGLRSDVRVVHIERLKQIIQQVYVKYKYKII